MQKMMYVIDPVKVKGLMLTQWRTAEQKKLAEVTGLTEATIVRMFQGYGFSPESLYLVCKALGCQPNDILEIAPKSQTLVGATA